MPGLIYDLVCVNPQSLNQRRADWVKVVKVWNRIAAFVRDPANQAEAVKMMAARAGVPPEEYAKFMPGTRFLSPEEALTRFVPKDSLESLFGSGKVADEFNVANKVYAQPQPVAAYIDGSLSKEALGTPSARQRGGPRSSRTGAKRGAAMRGTWSRPLAGLNPRASAMLWAASFIVPVLIWCALSYLPFVWHPMVRVTDPGDVAWMTTGLLVERPAFTAENAEVAARGGHPAIGVAVQPGLPAAAARGAARAGHRLHDAARPSRGAVAAREPVAQHQGDLLGLPAVVAHRRAAGHPVRRVARRWAG